MKLAILMQMGVPICINMASFICVNMASFFFFGMASRSSTWEVVNYLTGLSRGAFKIKASSPSSQGFKLMY